MTAKDEPGYHELITTDEKPALQPTAAFPASRPPVVVPTLPVPRTSTGLVLAVLTVVMGIVATVLFLTR